MKTITFSKNNVKHFLYAYIIVINHENIFGFNTRLEKLLINSSMDMLYIFINLCNQIADKKIEKLNKMLHKFVEKYKNFYKSYHKWQKKDAKKLLDILTSSYYNLSHSLIKINKDDIRYKEIINQISVIKDKVKYLLIDNTGDKKLVAKYLSNSIEEYKVKNIYKKAEKYFWDIQIYNLENNIKIEKSLREILYIINNKIIDISKTMKIDIEINPIQDFIFFLKNKKVNSNILYESEFLNIINFIIEAVSKLENSINKKSNKLDLIVDKIICQRRCTNFANQFINKKFSEVIPTFFRETLNELNKIEKEYLSIVNGNIISNLS